MVMVFTTAMEMLREHRTLILGHESGAANKILYEHVGTQALNPTTQEAEAGGSS